MTAVLDTEPAPASARPVTTPRQAWRRARLPVALGAAIALVALFRALTLGTVGADYLDPEAAGPEGGRALATVLRDHGVDVRRVESPSPTGAVVFMPVPDLATALQPGVLAAAANADEIVLVAPDDAVLAALQVPAHVADEVGERAVDPGCSHPGAVAAGDVRLGGETFVGPQGATTCYAVGGFGSFVEIEVNGRHITLLGTGAFMTNDHLDERGNAALALRLLLRRPTLEWVYPKTFATPGSDGEKSLTDLLPHRVFVTFAEVLVVVLLLALWRGRRLGPVVVEPLPVVVRAAEAVEGRARLYEAAGARDRAAFALRAGRRDRLVHVLGLTPDAGPETVVAAVTARTGRDGTAVGGLLYGPPPPDDAALVRLATELDRLDSEVRAL